jgi:hypothetical protein
MYEYDISTINLDYLEHGIDLRKLNNLPSIIALNEKSALWVLNNLKETNIKDLIKDIKTVINKFSEDVSLILS